MESACPCSDSIDTRNIPHAVAALGRREKEFVREKKPAMRSAVSRVDERENDGEDRLLIIHVGSSDGGDSISVRYTYSIPRRSRGLVGRI